MSEQNTTDFTQDTFLDPDLTIVETNGLHGLVKWDPSGGAHGYFSDMVGADLICKDIIVCMLICIVQVIMVKLKDFQISECLEWLDPVSMLLASGSMVPCFPFYY